MLNYHQRKLKWVCCTGGKTFEDWLIVAYNNFLQLLKSFIFTVCENLNHVHALLFFLSYHEIFYKCS